MNRIHHTNKKTISIPYAVPYVQKPDHKPDGLWYGINWEWEEWCESNMPNWRHGKHFSLQIDMEKILLLDSIVKINNFQEEYGQLPDWMAKRDMNILFDHIYINWKKVAEKYSGIEINPYQYSLRHKMLWLSGWDISSGCIWNLSAIKSLEPITKK